MSDFASNSPPKSQSSTSLPTNPSFTPRKMAAKPPIEVGMKGPVGSLIMQEIEFFNGFEVHYRKHSLQLPEAAKTCTNGGYTHNKPKVGSMNVTPKRKNGFISSICSAIEVENTNGPKLVSGLRYKNLKRLHA